MFLAQIASVKQWGLFYRDSGVEKGPAVSLFVSTFLPMRVPCFRKTPLYHKQELLFIEGKNIY